MLRNWIHNGPSFGKLMLVELIIEALVMSALIALPYISRSIISFVTGEEVISISDIIKLQIESIIFLTVFAFSSFFFRIWNQLPVCWMLRCWWVKRRGVFDMRHSLAIIAPIYIFFFVLIMVVPGVIDSYGSRSGGWLYAIDLGTKACGAALLAPLLTYRLTGYVLECNFSLPPWSHGKWGFGKQKMPE